MEKQFQILLAIGVSLIIGIPTILWYQKVMKKRLAKRKAARKLLIDKLSVALREKKINSFEDFSDFIEGFDEINVLRLSLPHAFDEIILNAKHILISEGTIDQNLKKTIDEIKAQIQKEIKESELQDPFKNVPSSERNLLIDLLEISQLRTNEVFVNKLHKLGELIRIREDLFDKAGKDSEESLRIAKNSRFLAILFFLISLALGIYSIMK
jgi:hypothetical protein